MFRLRPFLPIFATFAALLAVSCPQADAWLVNPGFDGPQVQDLGDVTRNPITNDSAGTWLLGGHDAGSDDWDIDGSGAAAVASNDNGNEAQGMVQWAQDNKATVGPQKFNFDFRMQSGSGDYDLHLYVFGWNAGDNAPGVDYENGSAETGDSFIPDDSVNLITDPTGTEGRLVLANNGSPSFSGVVDNGVFQPISVNVDFGTGYDFLGVLFYAENDGSGGILQIDNTQFVVPEPGTLLVWSLLAGLGLALARRRRR